MHRVLVADDEVAYRKHLQRALVAAGYCVAVAASQGEAMDIAPRFRPDVVVADWILGGELNGLQLANRLREANPQLRIIIITGFTTEALERDPRRPGVFALLEKPFPVRRLIEAIEGAVEHATET